MKRHWTATAIAIGILLLLAGLIYDIVFAGIPYQDPTPEMSARYARHSRIAAGIRWAGVVVLLGGAVRGCAAWVRQRALVRAQS
ncbi:hypothetical protein LBMAG56_44840 [Verrucomicrobiota bacterium]|nr:hypothetical protein LBMAG56_44840 [Verrucomicrobiota bacterium]